MKGLTLTQPWATLVAEGTKTFETRSWRTWHRGNVLIHAAKGFPVRAMRFAIELHRAGILRTPPGDLPRGEIIAVARIIDCRPTLLISPGSLTSLERELGDFEEGRFAWELYLIKAIAPVPWRGSLGLWEGPDL